MGIFEQAYKAFGALKGSSDKLLGRFSSNTRLYFLIALCCAAFIAGGVYCLVYEYYFYAFVPLALLGLLFIVYRFKDSILLVSLLTPFAIKVTFGEASLSMPTEPILIIVMLLFLWQLFFAGGYDKKIFSHPVSVALLINLAWTLVTCLTSQDMMVSFKYLLSQLWFIVPCFFFLVPLFGKTKRIWRFVALYSFSLCIVIIYSTLNFASSGFDFNFAYYAMQPFYNDHTAYGAIIALIIPMVAYYLIYSVKEKRGIWRCVLLILALGVLILGFVLSYSRAAWLSLCAAVGIWALVKSNIKLKTLVWIGVAVLLLGALSWNSIVGMLEKNEQDSSGNIAEHLTSVTNISTDASNVERLNRWACALEMFKEYPVFGAGAGTYAFLYSAYQKSYNLSIISTDAGDLGSTHSEYLRPLAEQGLIGMFTTTAVFVVTVIIGLRAYRRCRDKSTANLALFITMALCTYYVHGVLNQFLETDKLAVPFWAFTAAIVAIDLYAPKKDKAIGQENNTKGRCMELERQNELTE